MSDNVQDKIAETINNMIKKGNFFTKVKKIEKLIYGCAALIIVFGSSIIVNGFYNSYILVNNADQQDKQQMVIRNQSENIQKLHYKVDKLLELNKKLFDMLFAQNDPIIPFMGVSELNDDKTLTIKSSVSSLTCEVDEEWEESEELERNKCIIVNRNKI